MITVVSSMGGGLVEGDPGQFTTNQSLRFFFMGNTTFGILDFVLAVIGIKLEFLRNFSEPSPNERPQKLGFCWSMVPIFELLAHLGTVVDDLQMLKLPEGSVVMKCQPASRRSSSVPFKGERRMKRRTITQLSERILESGNF